MPIESLQQPLTVAVVGATGLVGRTMIPILAERGFPVGELRPLASRGDGRSVDFGGRSWPVEVTTPEAFEGVDIALFSAGGGASKVFAPEAVARGAVVVDNSSQWRMEPGVPARRGRRQRRGRARTTRASSPTPTAPRCS